MLSGGRSDCWRGGRLFNLTRRHAPQSRHIEGMRTASPPRLHATTPNTRAKGFVSAAASLKKSLEAFLRGAFRKIHFYQHFSPNNPQEQVGGIPRGSRRAESCSRSRRGFRSQVPSAVWLFGVSCVSYRFVCMRPSCDVDSRAESRSNKALQQQVQQSSGHRLWLSLPTSSNDIIMYSPTIAFLSAGHSNTWQRRQDRCL